MRRIILLTGVSASGKSTLQDYLMKEAGYKRPLNFTTRNPRDESALMGLDKEGDFNSTELDEYIFLNREQFFKKLRNGDFLENTFNTGNFYAASKLLPQGDICIVLDPIGRTQVQEYFSTRGIPVETYYLEISKGLQLERLNERGSTNKDILARQRDFNWFSHTNKCVRLNGSKDVKELADFIINREV